LRSASGEDSSVGGISKGWSLSADSVEKVEKVDDLRRMGAGAGAIGVFAARVDVPASRNCRNFSLIDVPWAAGRAVWCKDAGVVLERLRKGGWAVRDILGGGDALSEGLELELSRE
jgi:hypothetical protein